MLIWLVRGIKISIDVVILSNHIWCQFFSHFSKNLSALPSGRLLLRLSCGVFLPSVCHVASIVSRIMPNGKLLFEYQVVSMLFRKGQVTNCFLMVLCFFVFVSGFSMKFSDLRCRVTQWQVPRHADFLLIVTCWCTWPIRLTATARPASLFILGWAMLISLTLAATSMAVFVPNHYCSYIRLFSWLYSLCFLVNVLFLFGINKHARYAATELAPSQFEARLMNLS